MGFLELFGKKYRLIPGIYTCMGCVSWSLIIFHPYQFRPSDGHIRLKWDFPQQCWGKIAWSIRYLALTLIPWVTSAVRSRFDFGLLVAKYFALDWWKTGPLETTLWNLYRWRGPLSQRGYMVPVYGHSSFIKRDQRDSFYLKMLCLYSHSVLVIPIKFHSISLYLF